MRHEIQRNDPMRGREPRTIVWDDALGTVEGDHSVVPAIAAKLAGPFPVFIGDVTGALTLADPARRAEDFLALLRLWTYSPAAQPPLPDALRGVEPTAWVPAAPLGPGEVA